MALQLKRVALLAMNRSISSVRSISRSVVCLEKSAAEAIAKPIEPASRILSSKTHAVNGLEKRLLVWTGKYKSVAEVPSLVAPETVEKARNKARIRGANIMMLLTAFGCLLMVISGKKAAARGESLQKANLDWHKRINEEEDKNK